MRYLLWLLRIKLTPLVNRALIFYQCHTDTPLVVAPQLTVVTIHTTAQSSVVALVKDAPGASVMPNDIEAHETTAVHLSSSHGR